MEPQLSIPHSPHLPPGRSSPSASADSRTIAEAPPPSSVSPDNHQSQTAASSAKVVPASDAQTATPAHSPPVPAAFSQPTPVAVRSVRPLQKPSNTHDLSAP